MNTKCQQTLARERRLKEHYLEALPSRLNALQLAMHDMYNTKEKEKAFVAVCRAVHNLAGSSAMYGFEQIGDKASEMEACLEVFIEGNTLPTKQDEERLMQYLNELRRIKVIP